MSGGPNSPVGPRDPSPFSDEGGLQGILAQWNNTNQQLVQIVQALKSIVYLFPGSYTFATLPPAGQNAYKRAMITDGGAPTLGGAAAGGGGNTVPVYSDGAVWRYG